ncbi:TraB/GumN family protein [Pelagibius marinus]|uniref:TraB/GumN family protein n=1 Tax=Pelagibius marinus TaxID=2762760 RepID=UPI0018730AAA|nr:TraB/GumN family protein [Pelagibius marinus]
MLKSLQSKLFTAPLAVLAAAFLWLTPAAAAENIPFSQGLLWQLQKDDAPASYLLGTMHSTDPRLRELPREIDQALDRSQVAAFEIVTGQGGEADMAQALQLPPGRNLEDIIGAELFGRTAAAVADFGVTPEGLQRMKPWALSFFLARPRIEVIRQAQGEPAFDFWLQGEAQRRGKALHGLESYAEQLEIFDGLSEAEQVTLVADLLNDHEHIVSQFNAMFRAYLKGDTATLMTFANDYSGVDDAAAAKRLAERMIDDRNHTMAERMVPLLEQGRAFVAVGALHLPGEEGILSLLQQRGYRVTRLY